MNKPISLEEFKANLYELYDYSKKHYYENRPLTQHEKELLVKWGHVLIKLINTVTTVYDFDTTIHNELNCIFTMLYTSVVPIPIEYQYEHQITYNLNKKLNQDERNIIISYLEQLDIDELHKDPDLDVDLRL